MTYCPGELGLHWSWRTLVLMGEAMCFPQNPPRCYEGGKAFQAGGLSPRKYNHLVSAMLYPPFGNTLLLKVDTVQLAPYWSLSPGQALAHSRCSRNVGCHKPPTRLWLRQRQGWGSALLCVNITKGINSKEMSDDCKPLSTRVNVWSLCVRKAPSSVS